MDGRSETGGGIGQAGPAQGGFAAAHRQGPLRRRSTACPSMAFAAMVRSPHAHARIGGSRPSGAKAAPGVIAVFTGADFLADGRKPIPHIASWSGPPDVTIRLVPGAHGLRRRAAGAADRQGALCRRAGRDGGRGIRRRGARTRPNWSRSITRPCPPWRWRSDAIEPGARAGVGRGAGANLCVDGEVGDKAATDAAFARAAHVVRLETWIQRVTGMPMEPRAAIGDYDPATQRYTHLGRHRRRRRARAPDPRRRARRAARILPRVCGDMGGNFGTRNTFFSGIRAAALGGAPHRPAGQMDRRAAGMLPQRLSGPRPHRRGRAGARRATAISSRLRGTNLSNVGAYTAHFTPLRKGLGIMSGVYRIPAIAFPRPRRAHQHAADHALSQRRPARGDLCDRAADRSRRRRARLRSGRAAPAQPHPAGGVPLHQRRRHHLRQRRIRERHGRGADARGLAGLRRAARGIAAARHAARHRHRQLHRGRRRRPARARRGHGRSPRAASSWCWAP